MLRILNPGKACFQWCLYIAFLSGQWSDARQVMINHHLLVKVIGRISSGNSWDGWRCLISADVVVTPAKSSLGFQIYDTLWMETVLIVIAGKTSWWFCFLLYFFFFFPQDVKHLGLFRILEVRKWNSFVYQDNSQW